ncbi:MAG: FHA domain-containing protein [Bacteroidales bacterium]|nr:FHA domain-containing protein [Candidatus Latescibacterota bacterium]
MKINNIRSGSTGTKPRKYSTKTGRNNCSKHKNGRAGITITNGCFSGLEIPLKKDTTVLGSDISCDVCLDHSFVSDQHATITKSDNYYVLEDLNSRHGTSINGNEVHKTKLKKGDLIGIGNFELRFRN